MFLNRYRQLCSGAFASLLLLTCVSSYGQTTTVIVQVGDPVPNGNGTFISFIEDMSDDFEKGFPPGMGPYINDASQVVFTGFLTDTADGTDDDSAIYRVDNCLDIIELAREGDVPPDGDGVLNLFNAQQFVPNINDDGVVAFSPFIRESKSGEFFESALWVIDDAPGAEVQQLLRYGDIVPGTNGPIQSIFQPALNNAGQLVVVGETEKFDPLGARAIFRADIATGEVTLLADEETVVPNGNGEFNLLSSSSINDAGQISFQSTISSSQINDAGIFRIEPDNTMTKIVRYGDSVPESNETFSQERSLGVPINESGVVAFSYLLSDSGGSNPPSGFGIFTGDGETITCRARSGDPAPGGGTFLSFGTPGSFGTVIHPLNDAGQITVFAFTSVTRGIFRLEPQGKAPTLIAVAGQPAPGGGVFQFDSSPPGFDSSDLYAMNESGQVAFFTNVDIGPILDEAIFFYDDQMGLVEVVREGDPMLGSTVSELRWHPINSGDNPGTGFNNKGEVAYVFELANGGGGVAIWSPDDQPCATTPLPGDIDGNGIVNTTDLLMLLAAWGPCDDCPEDIDGDGTVGTTDLLTLLANWG